MAECDENCESCSTGDTCKDPKKEIILQEKAVSKRLSKIKHKIMVMSGKGGVGKTTVAVNLALALAEKGLEVGLMDADIHGPNVPKMLGIEKMYPTVGDGKIWPVIVPPRLKIMSMAFLLQDTDSPVIWRGPMKMTAIRQFISDVEWGELDFLIVDLPPGTGDEPLSVAQLIKDIDGSIIVTTPQDVALLDSRKSVNFARQLKTPIVGIVENMSGFVCPKCGERIDLFKVGGGQRSAKEMDVPFLGAVPIDPRIVEDSDSGKPFILDGSPASEAFEKIADKIRITVSGKKLEVFKG
ncbi:MAG: Mrp/NBP35 family ATP-binding protein [Halobacteriota archaeon]|nr:Mrp/NBP35 family ATP-binding protein [Halobacteriota archaeon]